MHAGLYPTEAAYSLSFQSSNISHAIYFADHMRNKGLVNIVILIKSDVFLLSMKLANE